MLTVAGKLDLSVIKIVLIALTAIFALFVLLAFLRFGFIFWIYSMIEDWTTVRLGFNYYVSNLIATVFVSVFSLLLPMLAWYFFLGKKQAWGIGTIVGVQVLICLSVYTFGRGFVSIEKPAARCVITATRRPVTCGVTRPVSTRQAVDNLRFIPAKLKPPRILS